MTTNDTTTLVHLTETGYHAGRRLCLTDRYDGARNMHAAYAPLNNSKFRATVCTDCLKVWANDAYTDGEPMPDYIAALRINGKGE